MSEVEKKNGPPRKDPRKVATLAAAGASGTPIRPEVIRAMEGQHRAVQGLLDELHDFSEELKRAWKLGMIRVGH